MRDPYDVLGIKRGASFEEIKAAYRRACKTKHPDMGGSQQDFIELQAAYEAALNDLKQDFQAKREEAPQTDRSAAGRDDARWERAYRDIDDELEELRRTTRQREEALHAMRAQAWEEGNRVVWAKLTWQDITRFFAGIVRSGLKGIALLCAALIGLGSVLVEANAVSAIIMLGGGLGFVISQALKSDKDGMLSAGLLLFGTMTIWLPAVRQALVHFPVATISLLVCLALIFKFGQQGGLVGLMTGGILTLYVVAVILARTPEIVPHVEPPPGSADRTNPAPPPGQPVQRPPQPSPEVPPPAPPPTREVRELIASNGAILRLVAGIAYRFRVRGGFTTSIVAIRGGAASYDGDKEVGMCTDKLNISAAPGAAPYVSENGTYRACGGDALLRVTAVR